VPYRTILYRKCNLGGGIIESAVAIVGGGSIWPAF